MLEADRKAARPCALTANSRFQDAVDLIGGGEANHRPHEQQESSRRRMLELQKKPNKVKR